MKTKTVTFEGNTYEVENWVNYVTRDEDGDLLASENEPTRLASHWWARDGRSYYITLPNSGWTHSLTKV